MRALIEEWMQRSSQLAIKKLARNDCSWADNRDNHQNGFYVPKVLFEHCFFPRTMVRREAKPHIHDVFFPTLWLPSGEIKESRLVHYTNKGAEVQLTGVPREAFSGLNPASWILIGKVDRECEDAEYWCVVLDSQSEDAAWIETLYDLGADFHASTFLTANPAAREAQQHAALQTALGRALESGNLDQFIAKAAMPQPIELAKMAQGEWKEVYGQKSLDPYAILQPGDALMEISRDLEYRIFKQFEMRHRAAQVLRLLIGKRARDLASAVVQSFTELNQIFLSSSQVRRSRAGRSFEYHIATMLTDGNIRFQPQKPNGRQRPDFVLPTLERVKAATGLHDEAMILSAKTTLRERWKQVSLEQVNSAFFLATVDDRVSADAIDAMADEDIVLVVPESLKRSKETAYGNKSNVITFRDFFVHEVSHKRPSLRQGG